jgi:hypothetical protein
MRGVVSGPNEKGEKRWREMEKIIEIRWASKSRREHNSDHVTSSLFRGTGGKSNGNF